MKIYSKYNPSPAEGIDFSGEETLTQQQFKDECDINLILKRHGVLPTVEGAFYSDFESSYDLRESLEMIQQAQSSFDSLPATVRDKFANDPGLLMDFVHDPANRDKFAEYGLSEANLPSRDSTPLDVTVTTDTSLQQTGEKA